MSSRSTKTSRSNSIDQSTGAVDDDQFRASFGDAPKLNIYTQKDVTDKLLKIRETLADPNQDWDKRCTALKELRSLLNSGHLAELPDLPQQLRLLDPGMQTSLRDLRSQVVREASITAAHLSVELGPRFESSADVVMQVLVPLMQNSAKVIASSAVTAARFILKNVRSQKLISTVASNLSSKSNIIRRQCCDFLNMILTTWSRTELERPSALLQDSIKKGLSDADADARSFSRKSFAAFSLHFPALGYSILNSFDASKQKQLLTEMDDPDFFAPYAQSRTRGMAPDVVPVTPKSKAVSDRSGRATPVSRLATSTPKPFCTPKPTPTISTPRVLFTPKTDSKVKPRSGVSHSTPTSRSGSPTRVPFKAAMAPPESIVPIRSTLRTPQPIVRKTPLTRKAVSQSQCNSREVSPTRREIKYNCYSTLRRGSEQSHLPAGNNSQANHVSRGPVSVQSNDNMLEYSRNLEAAISDAWRQKASWFRSSDEVDAFSETSSICSEGSYRSHSDMTEETIEILSHLVCGLWSERKDGTILLQKFLRSGKRFNNTELKRVMDVIMRMFHDPHPKVILSLLESLVDLVYAHHVELYDWLPNLVTRLLGKAGSDVLGNLQDRVAKVLEAIRDTFQDDRQLSVACRYVVEQPQNINIKTKQALLAYLLGVVSKMDSSSLVNNSDMRSCLTRVLTWTSEPKNVEVRKLSQMIITTLWSRCPDQFGPILSLLPKTYQEGTRRVLADNGFFLNNNNRTPVPKLQVKGRATSRSRDPSPGQTGSRKNSLGYQDPSVDCWDDEIASLGIKQASEQLQQLSLLGELDLSAIVSDGQSPPPNGGDCGDAMGSEDLGVLLEKIRNAGGMDEWTRLMNQLATVVRLCDLVDVWDSHFKMTFLLLLESLQDQENPHRKCLALFVLKEMLERQWERFQPYAELTVMNLLELEREKDREVIRASEECRNVLSRSFPIEQLIGILNPVSVTADYPINMAAVKLETKVVQNASTEAVVELLPVVTPGLVKGFEHNESSMRKASMLCLLALHRHVGTSLMPHLKDLSPNKMKLLNVYITRNCDDSSQ